MVIYNVYNNMYIHPCRYSHKRTHTHTHTHTHTDTHTHTHTHTHRERETHKHTHTHTHTHTQRERETLILTYGLYEATKQRSPLKLMSICESANCGEERL